MRWRGKRVEQWCREEYQKNLIEANGGVVGANNDLETRATCVELGAQRVDSRCHGNAAGDAC